MTMELLKQLTKEGLITRPRQLREAGSDPAFKPPGEGKKVGGKTVYPHFG